jgi:hypothetical protein
VGDLACDYFNEGGIKKYSSFLNNFTVFTRWYSLRSGINNMSGDYTPEYS